ncbi:MAG: ABC transporter substrate-binding protein [Calothrix sp. C42_A2020_038]|nr:ABC transporter substrate-binding protein [Calothrix sp. C42_A2020_038]
MTHSVPLRNPYIIGRPIDEPKLLFGRQELFGFLEENLKQGIKVTLLHGQRRIGKSSIIRNIPRFVGSNDFVFIRFDLECYRHEALCGILSGLIKEIIEHLKLDTSKLKPPNIQELQKEVYSFYSKFLVKLYHELGEKKIVLLLDEFDVLIDSYYTSNIEHFFTYLHSITEVDDKLSIIVFAGRQSADMSNLISIFPNASTREIGFLNQDSAIQLITQPANGVLKYDPQAIQLIIKLSAGHPYFIQIICFAIFIRARELEQWHIRQQDVEIIIDKAIENAEAGLAWFWDGLNVSQKVVFSAVAESQKKAIEQSQLPESPLKFLQKYGVRITDSLTKAAQELVKYKFLNDTGNNVRIELVRRWLLQRHPLRQEIKELENLDYPDISQQPIQNKKRGKLAIYERNLVCNPNSFSSVLALAEGYMEEENYYKALEFYERAYQVDPVRNKESFLQALEKCGDKFRQQFQFTEAKKLFDKVLTIEPFRFSAREKQREIEALEEKEFYWQHRVAEFPTPRILNSSKKNINKSLIAVASLAFIPLLAVGINHLSKIYHFHHEQDSTGIFSIIEQATKNTNTNTNFSAGERTLFPIARNTYRDQGVQAFNVKNYQKALTLFAKAVKEDAKDPEVLIYYNNTRARQHGNTFKLAVVVPIDTKSNIAKEMLRGVAQAQNEFNRQYHVDRKSKLLEIIIANDANEPEQAKKIASELAKNQSILGIIGHYSSATTKAALEEYKKAGISIISPTSTSNFLQGANLFRTVPSDAAASKKLAQHTFQKLHLRKVAVFSNPDSSYSHSISKEFQQEFEKLGGKVVHSVDITSSTFDAEKEVKASVFIYRAQAALLVPDTQNTDVALKIAQANHDLIKNQNQQGLKLLGTDNLYSNQTLSAGGNRVEGLTIAVPWFRETAQAKNFAQKAAQQWGGGVSWRTATSYDATQAFIQALSANQTNPTRLKINNDLKNINITQENTSGYTLQFTSDRERQTEPNLVTVKNCRFVAIP